MLALRRQALSQTACSPKTDIPWVKRLAVNTPIIAPAQSAAAKTPATPHPAKRFMWACPSLIMWLATGFRSVPLLMWTAKPTPLLTEAAAAFQKQAE